jgi:hypothetical protein
MAVSIAEYRAGKNFAHRNRPGNTTTKKKKPGNAPGFF